MSIKEIVKSSEWLDQSRSGDPMKGRIVILKWIRETPTDIMQYSTHEQWEDSSKPEWETPEGPNYCYGHYFNEIAITDEILVDFHERVGKLFSRYI